MESLAPCLSILKEYLPYKDRIMTSYTSRTARLLLGEEGPFDGEKERLIVEYGHAGLFLRLSREDQWTYKFIYPWEVIPIFFHSPAIRTYPEFNTILCNRLTWLLGGNDPTMLEQWGDPNLDPNTHTKTLDVCARYAQLILTSPTERLIELVNLLRHEEYDLLGGTMGCGFGDMGDISEAIATGVYGYALMYNDHPAELMYLDECDPDAIQDYCKSFSTYGRDDLVSLLSAIAPAPPEEDEFDESDESDESDEGDG